MAANIDFFRMFRELPAPYALLDANLHFIIANRKYLEVTNTTLRQIKGEYIFDVFPETEERIAKFKAGFEQAAKGTASKILRERYVIADPDAEKGHSEIWWTTHQFPLRDKTGAIIGIVLKVQDVTANVEAERTRDVVLREFDHRMNNMLAKVNAIARRTGEAYPKMADFMPRFESRIQAMANTQKLLIRTKWQDVELRELVQKEFAPYQDAADARIAISGPDIRIEGNVAQALGMAFHELATNAAKYGALSVPKGEVALSWRHSEKPEALIIEWKERGLPKIENMPESSGFGSMIIDKFTPLETGGTVERCFDTHSMTCTITLPHAEN